MPKKLQTLFSLAAAAAIFTALIALAASCKDQKSKAPAPVKAEEAAKATPEPGAIPASAPAAPKGGPEPAIPAAPAEVADNPYIHMGDPNKSDGPPRPPVADNEGIAPADLNDWKELSIVRDYSGGPAKYPTPLSAQLDRDALNNQGKGLFHFVMQGDLETAMRKYPLDEVAYLDFLQLTGQPSGRDLYTDYREAIANAMHEQGGRFAKFIGPSSRHDKLLSVEYRVARWYFKYENTEGRQMEACFLFMLSRNAWRIVDMDCSTDS